MPGPAEVSSAQPGGSRVSRKRGIQKFAALLAAVAVLSYLGLAFLGTLRTRIAVARCRSDLSFAPAAIEHLGGPEAAPAELGLYLRLPEWFAPHRLTALYMLGVCGAPAVPQLCAALGDRQERVRRNAAALLGAVGDARAVEPLAAALSDPSEAVRRTVMGTLASAQYAGFARPSGPLLERLADAREATDVRVMAADLLGRGRDPAAIPALERAAGDPDALVAGAARQALESIRSGRAAGASPPDTDGRRSE